MEEYILKKQIKQKHAIRKYKAGASSVLLGLFVFFGLMTEEKAKAAEAVAETSETTKKKRESLSTNESTGNTTSSSSVSNDANLVTNEAVSSDSNSSTIEAVNTATNTSVDSSQTDPTTETQTEMIINEVPSDSNDSTSTVPQTSQSTNEISTDNTSTNQTSTINSTEDMSQQRIIPLPNATTTSLQNVSTNSTPPQTPTDSTSQTFSEPTLTNQSSTVNTGQNVTQKVQITKATIEGKDVVNPHNAERVTLKYDWQFPDGMKEGDYFDFSISNNVNTHGISTARKLPDLKNGSIVMATGQLIDEHNIRYTFTDYINNKVNVVGSLSLNLFIDPKVVTTEGKQTITSQLNNQTTTKDVNIAYLNGINNWGLNINGSIEYLNKETNTFKHIAYVNPIKSSINNPVVKGNITSGSPSTGTPTVKIFEYVGDSPLNQSVYEDTSNTQKFKDVTSTFNHQLTINSGGYTLTMDQLDKTYVVTYEGQYMNDANELNFLTELSGYPTTYPYYAYYPYYPTTVKWNNGVVFYQNNGTGQGIDQPLVESNLFEFTEDSGDGMIRGQYDGPMIEVEEEEYTETYDSKPDDISGFNPNVIEESEDSAPIDFIEDTGTEVITGSIVGAMEFEEDSNFVEFSENTTPEGMSGSNPNEVTEEIEENNLVEYEEETTPEGMSGSNPNEVTEEIEENNLVEYEEETTPEGMSGTNPSEVTEEIEENNLVEYEEETMPEGMSGSNPNEVTEEIEENNLVEYEEETMPEGMSGSNTSEVTEEIEENNLVEYEEETTPEGMSGSNPNEVTEEIEENNLVEYEEETTPEGMSGSHPNEVTEEIEENQIAELEETSEPKQDKPKGGAPTIKLNFNSKINYFNTPKTDEVQEEVPTEVEEHENTPISDEQTAPQRDVPTILDEKEIPNDFSEQPFVEEEAEVENDEIHTETNINQPIEENEENQVTNPKSNQVQGNTEVISSERLNQMDPKEPSTTKENQPHLNEENDTENSHPITSVPKETASNSQTFKSDKLEKNNRNNAEEVAVNALKADESKQLNPQQHEDINQQEEKEHESNKTTSDTKVLPETGNTDNQSGLIALFMTLIGSILAFRRRKKEDK